MIKELTRIANSLDSKGLAKEADYLDAIIRKIAVGGVGVSEFGAERAAVDPMAFLYKNRHPYAETTSYYSFKLKKWVYILSDIAQKHNLTVLDAQYKRSKNLSEEEQTKIYNSYNHALGQAIKEYAERYGTHAAWTERQRTGEGSEEMLPTEEYWLESMRKLRDLLFGGDIEVLRKELALPPTDPGSGVDPDEDADTDTDEETLEEWTERQRASG